MKKFLILLTAGILAFGLNAKPEEKAERKADRPKGVRPARKS